MMPTKFLLNPTGWLYGPDDYGSYWRSRSGQHPKGEQFEAFCKEFYDSIVQTFAAYQLPVIRLSKETPKEAVCTIFEKVNTGGVTLSVFELTTASFAADDDEFSLRDDWTQRKDRLSEYDVLRGVEGEQFLQVVALLTTQDKGKLVGPTTSQSPPIACKKRDILALSVADYLQWADKIEEGFVSAAKFLRGQYVLTLRDVPYSTQLTPLAAIFVELGDSLSANEKSLLERWFWSGIFGEVYAGSIETQFALDLAQVPVWIRGEGDEPTLVTEASIIPERLLTLRTRNSAAYKGLYALQMKSGAADWRSAKPLSLMTLDTDRIDIHHIFPKAWCTKAANSIPKSIYDCIINKTPIDSATNQKIGGSSPSKYVPRLSQDVSSDLMESIMDSHWIALNHLYTDEFGSFFVERGEAMFQLIARAMGKESLSTDSRTAFVKALKTAGLKDISGVE